MRLKILICAAAIIFTLMPVTVWADEIKNKCKSDWPDDYYMQLYCINEQKVALDKIKRGSWDTDIKRFCESQWPSDFYMQLYCMREQRESKRKIQNM